MTTADRALLVCLALAAALALPLVTALAHDGGTIVVRGPRGTTTIAAGEPRTLAVEGRRGSVEVRVEDGRARVVAADCPDQVCVRSGEVSRSGQALVCVPNGVSVTVGGDGDESIDVVVR